MTRAQLEAMVEQQLDEAVEKALAAVDARHATEIAELKKRFEERLAVLEKEPDPGQAPFRGSSVVGEITPDAERPSALRGSIRAERDAAVRPNRGGF